ncbi:MAG: hypothetical protein DA328_09585 [Nitrososphaeraceae archaeon]|nr:hypothetical protein [Nitrososphaeraceae archaeon]
MGLTQNIIIFLAVLGGSYLIWNYFVIPRVINVYDQANINVQGSSFFDKTTGKELTNSEVRARIKKLYNR